MDDNAAFERLIANATQLAVGPPRSVDVEAIVGATTSSASSSPWPVTTQRLRATSPSPKWRFQSIFSATKFVIASAIVALFGGLALAGVLMQPSDDQKPAVGASASPSSQNPYVATQFNAAGLWRRTGSIATDDALWAPVNSGDLNWAPSDSGVARMDGSTKEATLVPASDGIRSLVASDDAIWAVGRDIVQRIDRADLTVSDEIRRDPSQPFDCHQPIIADGSLWIASSGSKSYSLVEIDLAARSVTDEYLAADWSSDGCGSWMGVVGDAIWVHSTDPDGSRYRLTRFDLGTRAFTDTVDDLPGTENSFGCCVAADDAIWLMDELVVSRFDAATLEVTDTVDLGHELNGGVAAAGALWVVGWDGNASVDDERVVVYRIDATTREVTDTIALGHGAEPPAFLHGAIWVASHQRRQGSVSRIDVETRKVTDTVTLPFGHAHTPLASDGVIWVYTQEGRLMRIDPIEESDQGEAQINALAEGDVVQNMKNPIVATVMVSLLALSPVGVAAQDAERAAPVEVSGTRGDESAERCLGGDREARDGYIHEYGYTCTEASWTMSDPRLEGEVTTKFSVDFYSGEFADLNIGSSAFSIENDEGAWRERVQLGGGFPWGSESEQNFSVLDGEGAYEGLLAVLEIGDGEDGIRGFIFDGEFPPPPDNASTK